MNQKRTPVGQAWLRRELDLAVPQPAVESYLVSGTRRTEVHGSRVVESYPRQYAPGDSVVSHLRFMLRREPFDLGVLAAALKTIDPATLEDWVRSEPTGAYSRRAWFFYETFTGHVLDLENVRSGNYVEALDPERFIVAARRNSRRHRVIDNLLGGPGLCVTVRRTPKLLRQMAMRLDDEARALCEAFDRSLLTRAVDYLYTRETRSSFAIEGEKPSSRRAARFVRALSEAATFNPAGQGCAGPASRVDRRPALCRHGLARRSEFRRPDGCGLPGRGPLRMPPASRRALAHEGLDEPHRARLARERSARRRRGGFGLRLRLRSSLRGRKRPHSPGSSSITCSLRGDTRPRTSSFRCPRPFCAIVTATIGCLRVSPGPILEFIDWRWGLNRDLLVEGDTRDLYRFIDMTAFAEYLHDRVAETVRHDLREELGFIAGFDRAFRAVSEIVDMPDRRTSLLIRLCVQNGGRLSARKRPRFRELSDGEVAAIESAIKRAFAADPPRTGHSHR